MQFILTEYSELTLHNNVFYLSKEFDKALNFVGTNLISDYNIYYPLQEGFITFNGQEFSDLSELQQIENIDANSFTSDPLFIDAFNHNFAVETGSPVVDAGVFVGITADLAGDNVPYGNGPDIGVIETDEIASSTNVILQDDAPFQIYPNPTNGILNISFDNLNCQEANINIQNTNGSTLIEKQYSSLRTDHKQLIDISDVPAGIYILSVKLENSLYSKRIIKK